MEDIKMSKVTIAYWSQTGNTEMMANAIAEGVLKAGKEVNVDRKSTSLNASHIQQARMPSDACELKDI